jgi:hypothetical protein
VIPVAGRPGVSWTPSCHVLRCTLKDPIEIVIGGTVITISSVALVALAALVPTIGSLILLAGTSVFLVCFGIAVVLAVINGYVNIEASQSR